MLSKSIHRGHLGKWAYSLIEFDLAYLPMKAVKGQVVADFIADHHVPPGEVSINIVTIAPWKMYFD